MLLAQGKGYHMKHFYIKQKVFSLGEKFTIKNEREEDVYFVEGSVMKIPKTFSIMNPKRDEVGLITKKTLTFLPKFFVEVSGQHTLMIKKEFSFFKSRYTIDTVDMEIQGNWWEMNFHILQQGEVIGEVSKEWFTWGDSYKVKVLNEAKETTIISLVIAIDCVKADQTASSTTN